MSDKAFVAVVIIAVLLGYAALDGSQSGKRAEKLERRVTYLEERLTATQGKLAEAEVSAGMMEAEVDRLDRGPLKGVVSNLKVSSDDMVKTVHEASEAADGR